jgi:hypothetical protein
VPPEISSAIRLGLAEKTILFRVVHLLAKTEDMGKYCETGFMFLGIMAAASHLNPSDGRKHTSS